MAIGAIILIVIVIVTIALSVGIVVFTRRAGYIRGPLWQSPFTALRQVGPVRRVGAGIALVGLIAYLLAAWLRPVYLRNLVLGADFVFIGLANILEPMVPNTRLNFRWLGVAIVLMGVAELVLGAAIAFSHHRPSPLILVILVPIGIGIIISAALAYLRAFPTFPR